LHVSFMYYILRKYHIIEPLCFHYNGSAGVSFLLQQCIVLDNFLEGHSDYRAFGLFGIRLNGLALLYIHRDVRRVWRYQRVNQDPYIEEEQTTQWPKEKVQGQTTIYKAYIWIQRSRNTNPNKNRGWTQVLRKGRQFLLH
jgi:hypothetical protein